jgi:FKBP-type peptidyl-prolyl cis-trans isomerase
MKEERPPEGPPTLPSTAEAVRTESGLEYFDVAPGDGTPVSAGSQVRVSYRGWLTDGTLFDSTDRRGGPLEFLVAGDEVIPALDEGVRGMRPGGKRRLIVPSDLAYGPRGKKGSVPPFATLIFDVEVLSVR